MTRPDSFQKNFIFEIVFLLSAWISIPVSAQEMWGHSNSNYAGAMGLGLNPASIVGAPYEYEINILAGDFFYDNNYLYLPKLSDFKTQTNKYNDNPGDDNKFFDYNTPPSKHGYGNGMLIGPSYIRNLETRAWAVHTGLRAVASVNNVSSALAKGFYSKFDYLPIQDVTFSDLHANGAGLFFADLGGTYGKVYLHQDIHWLAWGATIKGIVAFDGAYLDLQSENYLIPDSSTLVLNQTNLDYGHALPANGGSLFAVRGFGGSADLGLIYIHKRNPGAYECGKDADRRKRYHYKAGLSLIDLGYVGFTNGATRIRVTDGNTVWQGIDTLNVESGGELGQEIVARFPGSTTTSDHFGIFMPTAICGQFDYCIKPRWYANLSVVQRLPLSHRQVYRANSIALVPRYETRRIEASLSANLYEYKQVALGASLRYGPLVIGTDRLLSFLGSEVRGLDFFFGIKFHSCLFKARNKNKSACPMNG